VPALLLSTHMLFLPSDSMVLHHSVIVEKPMGSAIAR